MKLDSNYLRSLILEVLGEDLLYEAWDSQWPSQFSELKTHIKDFTDKGKAAEDILSKYALEAMSFNHLRFKTIVHYFC